MLNVIVNILELNKQHLQAKLFNKLLLIMFGAHPNLLAASLMNKTFMQIYHKTFASQKLNEHGNELVLFWDHPSGQNACNRHRQNEIAILRKEILLTQLFKEFRYLEFGNITFLNVGQNEHFPIMYYKKLKLEKISNNQREKYLKKSKILTLWLSESFSLNNATENQQSFCF